VDRQYQFLYFNRATLQTTKFARKKAVVGGTTMHCRRLSFEGTNCNITGTDATPCVSMCSIWRALIRYSRRPLQFLYATHDGGTRQMNKESIYGGDPFENFNDASKNDFFAVWEEESQNHYSGEIYVVILFFFHQCQTKRHLDDLCTFRFGYKFGQSSQ
jgi:hypothetical protein